MIEEGPVEGGFFKDFQYGLDLPDVDCLVLKETCHKQLLHGFTLLAHSRP